MKRALGSKRYSKNQEIIGYEAEYLKIWLDEILERERYGRCTPVADAYLSWYRKKEKYGSSHEKSEKRFGLLIDLIERNHVDTIDNIDTEEFVSDIEDNQEDEEDIDDNEEDEIDEDESDPPPPAVVVVPQQGVTTGPPHTKMYNATPNIANETSKTESEEEGPPPSVENNIVAPQPVVVTAGDKEPKAKKVKKAKKPTKEPTKKAKKVKKAKKPTKEPNKKAKKVKKAKKPAKKAKKPAAKKAAQDTAPRRMVLYRTTAVLDIMSHDRQEFVSAEIHPWLTRQPGKR